eukprot:TRINITY_DN2840_c0_g1_i7.p1 TRINITY_DN2840_c0_g1~~TRINITY_DN2840_c0_g1_i7.p1  ORF type:complete len:209 (+),score=17.50 TRINITY_DN2840_c0_g1_i7:24-650(+)
MRVHIFCIFVCQTEKGGIEKKKKKSERRNGVAVDDPVVHRSRRGICWKNGHRLMCTGEACTASDRDRYEISIYKAQRNVILCIAACLLYWFAYRICKYYKDIQDLEETEKRCIDKKSTWKKLTKKLTIFARKCSNWVRERFYQFVIDVGKKGFNLFVDVVKFWILKKLRRGTRARSYLALGCFYPIVLVVLWLLIPVELFCKKGFGRN